jgi:hypothetical protein
VRSGPGAARTILLFHIISDRPSKQPLMVRTFLKVYMEFGSYFLFLQDQIKDIIIPLHWAWSLRGSLLVVATCRDGAGRGVCARPPFVTVRLWAPLVWARVAPLVWA